MSDDNPFERYGLDPRTGVGAITQRLRELAEDTDDPAERERLRATWEELTVHPARRLRAALFAHPDTRPPLGAPPPPVRARMPAAQAEPVDLAWFVARPSARDVLGTSDEARAPTLDDDPHLSDELALRSDLS